MIEKTNCVLLVKKLLSNLEFYEVWLQQNVGDVDIFSILAKQRLKYNFVQKWNQELNKSSSENRKCKHCQILEDEFHFILECPLYSNIRTLYVKRYYYTRPNMFKLTELMSSNSKKQIRNPATFIFKAFDERNFILYTYSDTIVCSSTIAVVGE